MSVTLGVLRVLFGSLLDPGLGRTCNRPERDLKDFNMETGKDLHKTEE